MFKIGDKIKYRSEKGHVVNLYVNKNWAIVRLESLSYNLVIEKNELSLLLTIKKHHPLTSIFK